jgi:uroporphyrinogen decarboxylase
MSKRDDILDLILNNENLGYVPAAFFLHFPEEFQEGQASAEKHMEYFRYTGMDFLKIQYEKPFPPIESIQKPEDWSDMPCYDRDFYAGQIEAVTELVEAADGQVLTVVTLYSAFMASVRTAGKEKVLEHLIENPEAYCKGLEIITESILVFVNACIDAGVDGFYASTQGREDFRFPDKKLFDDYVKPYDLLMWEKLEANCDFNILHVCDYHGKYGDLTPFAEYPGDLVNVPLDLTGGPISAKEAYSIFKRPLMGGIDRFGTIVSGPDEAIRETVYDTLDANPEISVLGADCTLPPDINWDNIKTAIDAAHSYEK